MASLLSTRFPSAGVSVAHFPADWVLDWSLAAKWVRLLVTQLSAAAYPNKMVEHSCLKYWRSRVRFLLTSANKMFVHDGIARLTQHLDISE